MRRNAEQSPAIVTALAPRIGYDAAARLVYQAQQQGASLQELVAAQGLDGSQGSDDVLLAMTRPLDESPG
jgi:fumarate hydratase class II